MRLISVVSDVELLTRLNSACLSGGLYVLLLDELVDSGANPKVRPARDFFLCHILFNIYLEDVSSIRPISWNRDSLLMLSEIDAQSYAALYEEELLLAGQIPFVDAGTVFQRCSAIKALVRELLLVLDRPEWQDT